MEELGKKLGAYCGLNPTHGVMRALDKVSDADDDSDVLRSVVGLWTYGDKQVWITVRPDLVEELGGVSNVLFPIDAPRVQTDATRAAIEAASDDDATLLADDRRARFCAAIDGRRGITLGEAVELAVDHRHLHFFDRASGESLSRRRRAGE